MTAAYPAPGVQGSGTSVHQMQAQREQGHEGNEQAHGARPREVAGPSRVWYSVNPDNRWRRQRVASRDKNHDSHATQHEYARDNGKNVQ